MKVINVIQRTDAWHEWRRGGLTATCAAIIEGASPYKTEWRLWAEYVGKALPPDLSDNPHVKWGVLHEDDARRAHEGKHNDLCLPVCIQSELYPFIRASLDGLNMADEPVELKCPSESTWQEVLKDGEKSAAYKLYWYQVQHQILACDTAQQGWLVFWRNGQTIEFLIQRDDAFLASYLKKAEAFWERVVKKKEPQKNPQRDVFLPQGEAAKLWVYEAEQYRRIEAELAELKGRITALQERQEPHLETMKAMMGDYMSADYCGVMVTRFVVAGRVDYKKLIEDQGISQEMVDAYRGEESERVRATVTEAMEPRGIIDDEVMQPIKAVEQIPSAWF